MVPRVHLLHYVNQFFAGIGGEEKADSPLEFYEGAKGPGGRLQELLGETAEIVVTASCGDNYFNDHQEEVIQEILDIVKAHNVKLVAAGPAFASGRHAFACIEICHAISTSLDIHCVTGISPDNPALSGYGRYKDEKVYAFPTQASVIGMEEALARIAKALLKLANGEAMGPALNEGYMPRGIRIFEDSAQSGAERAIDMLLDKVAERQFATEITVEMPERVPPAPPIFHLKNTHLALVSSAGITFSGNPYRFKIMANVQWKKYPIDKLSSMNDERWDVIHGGINTAPLYKDANYGAPLDVLREMEKEGVFASLAPNLYGTTGFAAAVAPMQTIGREIASDMKQSGVNGVLLVST